MAKVFMAPEDTSDDVSSTRVFLAGSIDMGKAVNWQEKIITALSDVDISIYNPRRDDWDSTWVQSITNAKFNEQVTWEMNHLDRANVICYVFDPAGQAPITLLELGLQASKQRNGKKIIVCCPNGYWRKGNVEMVCAKYSIPMVDTVEEVIGYLRAIA